MLGKLMALILEYVEDEDGEFYEAANRVREIFGMPLVPLPEPQSDDPKHEAPEEKIH